MDMEFGDPTTVPVSEKSLQCCSESLSVSVFSAYFRAKRNRSL